MVALLIALSLLTSSPDLMLHENPALVDQSPLSAGMDRLILKAAQASDFGDSEIVILRVDPNLWQLDLTGRAWSNGPSRTARQWAEGEGYVIATNAGMFSPDHRTHVGYLSHQGVRNSHRVNQYQSILAFGPRRADRDPPFRVFDLDDPATPFEVILQRYHSVVQNLRLIQRPGRNRWSQQPKRWSEAALGEDVEGRILFIFSRSPFSMHDLNRELLDAGIGIVAAQHLEGGPEAQLYYHLGAEEIELVGSYETGFSEHDDNDTAWRIPNVIGVRARVP